MIESVYYRCEVCGATYQNRHDCAKCENYHARLPEKGLTGQCLHARELKFIRPRTGESVHLETDLPPYFREVLDRLGQEI